MDTSLDGLKKLGTKMGGDMSAANTNAEALDVIADVYVDKEGTTLPNPTSSNAGKVATVVSKGSGKYAWDAVDVPSPIDDSASSSTKTYSSQKIESMLSNELPTPSAENLGKIARVVSDGQGGYAWSAEDQEEEFEIVLTQGTAQAGNPYPLVFDKTVQEIQSAVEAGKKVKFIDGGLTNFNYEAGLSGSELIPFSINFYDDESNGKGIEAIFLLASINGSYTLVNFLHIDISFKTNSIWYQYNTNASIQAQHSGESD